MMKTLIIGCGKTGTAIAKLLAPEEKIYTYIGNVVEDTTSLDKITDVNQFNTIIITLANGGPDFSKRNTWLMRDVELENNKESLDDLGNLMHKKNYKNRIIMISNPSDAFAKYYREKYGLNCESFGLALDSERYSAVLGRKVEATGHHGLSIPVLGSNKLNDYKELINEAEKRLVQQVRVHGINYDFVAKCFVEHYLNKKKENDFKLNKIEKDLLEKNEKVFLAQYTRLIK
jgi:peroxiredoxin